MTRHLSFLLFTFLLFFSTNSFAKESHAALATKAVSEDANEAAAAIAELRALGPIGLQSLLEANREAIDQHTANPTLKSTSDWLRITAALDGVSQQKDSYLSGLYWYKISEARKSRDSCRKANSVVRLLGKLTDS